MTSAPQDTTAPQTQSRLLAALLRLAELQREPVDRLALQEAVQHVQANSQNRNLLPPDPQPAVFITPVVERNARLNELSSWDTDGSNMALVLTGELRSDSLGDGLGVVPGQFVAAAVVVESGQDQHAYVHSLW